MAEQRLGDSVIAAAMAGRIFGLLRPKDIKHVGLPCLDRQLRLLCIKKGLCTAAGCPTQLLHALLMLQCLNIYTLIIHHSKQMS